MTLRPFALAASLLAFTASAPAWADDGAKPGQADALFTEGRKLLEDGKYAEACKKLDASEKLSPAVGTLLNLGYCWEQLGKMRSAMEAYSEAEILARNAGDTKRSAFARERLAAVEPRVLRLVLRVPSPPPPGFEVRRNGLKVPVTDYGEPIAVDQGDLVVTAGAPGREPFRADLAARGDGAVVTLKIPPLAPVDEEAPAAQTAPSALTLRRVAAIGLGVVAAAALGGGAAAALGAKARYDDALGGCDASGCDQAALDAQEAARTQGNIATALFALGALSAGAGIYLWIAGAPSSAEPSSGAPRKAPTRAARVSVGPLGASFGASF